MRIPLLNHRYYDPDEFEHLHAAWLVSNGEVPYRDFFEHHTPWLYYAVQPAFVACNFGRETDDAMALIGLARFIPLVVSAVAIALVIYLIRVMWDWNTAWAGAVLLSSMPSLLRKSLEFRPDVPAMLLWVGTWVALMHGLHRYEEHKAGIFRTFWLAGICLGASIMFTQKLIFPMCGLGLGLLTWIIAAMPRSDWLRKTVFMGAFTLGIACPFLITWLGFVASGAGSAFVNNNFLIHTAWTIHVSPIPKLGAFIDENWPAVFLALGGCAIAWFYAFSDRDHAWISRCMSCSILGILAGLFIMPVTQEQYYLTLVPLLAILGAPYYVELIQAMPQSVRGVAMIVSTCALCILPIQDARSQLRLGNESQIQQLKYVMDHTKPEDVVMDGWRGLGAFRKHAFFYYFLHPEIRGIIPPAELEAFLDSLEHGKVCPRLIVPDQNLDQLPKRFSAYVKENYVLEQGVNIYLSARGK